MRGGFKRRTEISVQPPLRTPTVPSGILWRTSVVVAGREFPITRRLTTSFLRYINGRLRASGDPQMPASRKVFARLRKLLSQPRGAVAKFRHLFSRCASDILPVSVSDLRHHIVPAHQGRVFPDLPCLRDWRPDIIRTARLKDRIWGLFVPPALVLPALQRVQSRCPDAIPQLSVEPGKFARGVAYVIPLRSRQPGVLDPSLARDSGETAIRFYPITRAAANSLRRAIARDSGEISPNLEKLFGSEGRTSLLRPSALLSAVGLIGSDTSVARPDDVQSVEPHGHGTRERPWPILRKYLNVATIRRVRPDLTELEASWELARLERVCNIRYSAFAREDATVPGLTDSGSESEPDSGPTVPEQGHDCGSTHKRRAASMVYVARLNAQGKLPSVWDAYTNSPVQVCEEFDGLGLCPNTVISQIASLLGKNLN